MSEIEEYTEDYCRALEMAYGPGMMSEGQNQGIDEMFDGIPLIGKKALDLGSGLGGVASYLATKYKMNVVGAEINPWMVQEATKRIPQELGPLLEYVLLKNDKLPFQDNEFDIIYSKGVLTHLQDKNDIFNELNRILKPDGYLVIIDWLSPTDGKWGPIISEMAETEGLVIYAQTEASYIKDLNISDFNRTQIFDKSSEYAKYNHQIVEDLIKNKKSEFIQKFGEATFNDHVKGYNLIAKAITTGELLVKKIIARK